MRRIASESQSDAHKVVLQDDQMDITRRLYEEEARKSQREAAPSVHQVKEPC